MSSAGAVIHRALTLVVFCAAGATRATAQTPKEAHWSLEGNHGGYCIWYLADPQLAKDLVPDNTVLTPAGNGAGLPAFLMRTVQDEPRFAQWIPATICIGYYDRVTANGATIAQGKGDRLVIVATSALAAEGARGIHGATNYLVDFMTNDRAVARAAENVGFTMGGIDVMSRAADEGQDPELTIRFDGVAITWSGHAIGDSGVGKTRSVSFGYAGARTTNWLIQLETTPATDRLMAGALQVVGRNTLAKALKTSPGRSIGPQESGGTTTLTFQSASKR